MGKELLEWLTTHRLESLLPLFVENDIDLDLIGELDDSDLKDLGLSLGQRKRFLAAASSAAGLSNRSPPDGSENDLLAAGSTEEAAERRQLSVMFCDLVGSTALSEKFDPEDMRELLRNYRQTCSGVVRNLGGFVARYIGDGILVYFGYPHARENDAENAVRAGLQIAEKLAEPRDSILSARIGIATGIVVVGDIVGDGTKEHHAVVGQTPNLAERLMACARPGQVVVSDTTQRLLVDLFEFHDIGAKNLKGFSQPVNAWSVKADSAVRSRSQLIHASGRLSPLVAREFELDRLQHCWARSRSGLGQVVLVSGEPGIGKSRLIRHFTDIVKEKHHEIGIKRLFCSHNHKHSTLFPLIDAIERDADIHFEDNDELRVKKIMLRFEVFGKGFFDSILDLLGVMHEPEDYYAQLSSDERRRQNLLSLIRYLGSFANEKPVIIVLEDLHWADSTTLELLKKFVLEYIQELPILLLLSFRTDFVPAFPSEHYITSVKISRLSHNECIYLINHISDNKNFEDEVIDEIIKKSDRIPLFVEEVFKATRDSVINARERDAEDSGRTPSRMDVPNSLAASLMEQLDRLGSAKHVAQVAATVGSSFSKSFLQEILPTAKPGVTRALEELVRSGIILPGTDSSAGSYAFKHALVHDAAYSSLLRSERQKLHAAIARNLEANHPDIARRRPEQLAQHFALGGLPEKAIDYWLKAGMWAFHNSAYSECVAQTTNGLGLLEKLPQSEVNTERELDLRTTLALALHALRGAGAEEVGANYAQARKLFHSGVDRAKKFSALIGCWSHSFISADLLEAQNISAELLELADIMSDTNFLAEAKRVHGMTLLYAGDFAGSITYVESALELYRQKRQKRTVIRFGPDPLICSESYLANLLLFLGHRKKATRKGKAIISSAKKLKHPYTHAFSLAFAAFVHQQAGLFEEARDIAEQAVSLADKHGFQWWAKQQSVIRNWAEVQLGSSETGLWELRKAVEEFLDMGPFLETTRNLCLLAEGYAKFGRTDECLAVLENALDTAVKSGEMFYLAEIHRLIAEVEAMRAKHGISDKACEHYSRSLDIAGQQKAVFWQQKTAESIAQLCIRLGYKPAEAKALIDLCGIQFPAGESSLVVENAHHLIENVKAYQPGE